MKRNLELLTFSLFLIFFGSMDSFGQTYSAESLRLDGKGWPSESLTFQRLPNRAQTLPVLKDLWTLGYNCAGINLCFQTDSQEIAITWELRDSSLSKTHMSATGVSGIDLYYKNEKDNWFFIYNTKPAATSGATKIAIDNPKGEIREYKLYLPLYNGLKDLKITIPDDKTFSQPEASPLKPIVFYGTSIVQGGCASRPGMAFTSIIERKLKRPVINLGFSGAGKMEPEVAALISEVDAEIFVIDCLWNLSDATQSEIQQRVTYMAKTLRNAHPEASILFVGQSYSKDSHPTKISLWQQQTVKLLAAGGLKKIYLLQGDNLIGSDGDSTVDGCHLTDLGMIRQAEVLERTLKSLLKQSLYNRQKLIWR